VDIARNADMASKNFYSERAAIGDRVSLNVNAGAGGLRRDMRWKSRSDVIRGVEESDAPERTEAETRPLATAPPTAPPVKNKVAPTLREMALRFSVPPPLSLPLSMMTVDSPMVATSGDNAPPVEAPNRDTREAMPTSEPPVATAAVPAPRVPDPVPTEVYRVGIGDVLDIRLLDGRTNNSSLYTVLAGGLVEYTPLGDPFVAAGKTADEIAAHIKSELRRRAIQDDPQVVVSVREYASHTVIVSGLVSEPGAKTLRREAVPLYVIIADAQPLPEAGRVLVMSYASGQKTEVALDDQAAMSALIGPGDIINVLGKQQHFYFIGGKVTASGQKEFHAGITLTQAILAAGGTLNEGKTALVTRQNADGLLAVSKHNLKEIMSGSAPDPVLQPGDRIEVIR
jgi:protein involved in polysaccharide export with SLBB domain